jgi:hypothetical protein
MAMLTLYLDESYSHPPAPLVYTVAGYIATRRNLNPLQAADILAYEMNKEMCRRLDKNTTRPVRRSMENLYKGHLDAGLFYVDREQLLTILDNSVKLGLISPAHDAIIKEP